MTSKKIELSSEDGEKENYEESFVYITTSVQLKEKKELLKISKAKERSVAYLIRKALKDTYKI